MAISDFYNTTAIKEAYTSTVDSFGQEVKTWTVSTTIVGRLQGRSGNESIVGSQELVRRNERFYCDVVSITEKDRLLFSTSGFSYSGTASASTDLALATSGALYYIDTAFSTYVIGDYAYNNGSTYVSLAMDYYDIIYINDNLNNKHLQVDLNVANKGQK